jgi:hypothetical protein
LPEDIASNKDIKNAQPTNTESAPRTQSHIAKLTAGKLESLDAEPDGPRSTDKDVLPNASENTKEVALPPLPRNARPTLTLSALKLPEL